MPNAWVNFNAAASLLMDSDPICGTCDIQATVRAPRRTNIGAVIEALCANPWIVLCSRAQRACDSLGEEAAPAPPRFNASLVIVRGETMQSSINISAAIQRTASE
jgi:hypothetical protein